MIYTKAIPDKTHITSLKFINLVFFIDIFFEKTSYPDCIYYYRISLSLSSWITYDDLEN